MKKKLLFGMTVLFMITAVMFIACPSDSGGASSDDGDDSEPSVVVPDVVITPNTEKDEQTLTGDELTLTVNVKDESKVKPYPNGYQWYRNTVNSNVNADEGGTGMPIPGANGKTFDPPTNEGNTTYFYYVVVTFTDDTTNRSDPFMVKVIQNDGKSASYAKITAHPQNNEFPKDSVPDEDLRVVAEIPGNEDGTLTFKWYVNTVDKNSGGTQVGVPAVIPPSGLVDVNDARVGTASLTPSTETAGTFYYYAEVVNTLPGNDGYRKTTTRISNTAKIVIQNYVTATVPAIKENPSGQPVNALYDRVNDPADPLKVVLEPMSGAGLGRVTYQWYINKTKKSYDLAPDGVTDSAGAVPIAGATEATYTPSTATNRSFWYYFCVITNTLDSAPDGYILLGATASVKSDIVYIGVGITPIFITFNPVGGVIIKTKSYDGETTAEVVGTAVGIPAGSGVTLKPGKTDFDTANVGTGKRITFDVTSENKWELQGSSAVNYFLNMPANVTGVITTAPGADVASKPVLDDTIELNPKSFKITVKAVAKAKRDDDTAKIFELQDEQQKVEYAAYEVGDGVSSAPVLNQTQLNSLPWSEGREITVPTAFKRYYIYARSKASAAVNPNFSAGTYKASDTAYRTVGGSAIDVGSPLTGTPMHNAIIVNPVNLEQPQKGQTVVYAVDTRNPVPALTQAQLDALAWQEDEEISDLQGDTNYYIYARSKADENYSAGEAQVSAVTKTLPPMVMFYTDGGGSVPLVQLPKVGNNFQKLQESAIDVSGLSKSGYTFDGWHTDRGTTKDVYDFDTVIDKSRTLYAKWVLTSKIEDMATSGNHHMIYIPTGAFMMGRGNNDDLNSPVHPPQGEDYTQHTGRETQHKVILNGFYMGKYEVTQALWNTVMAVNPSVFNATKLGVEDSGQYPVDSVNWYNAIVFCNRLSIRETLTPAYKIGGKTNPSDWGPVPTAYNGITDWDNVEIDWNANGYRLPTEAEWEYACRAGTPTTYSTGVSISDNTGWYTANSAQKTHQVGLKPSNLAGTPVGNAWGLYDMHGNVAEWCWDWYQVDLGSATVRHPEGPTMAESTTPTSNHPDNIVSGAKSRMFRGGSWGGTSASRYTGSTLNNILNNWAITYSGLYLRSAARSATVCLLVINGGLQYAYAPVYPFTVFNFVGMRLVRSN